MVEANGTDRVLEGHIPLVQNVLLEGVVEADDSDPSLGRVDGSRAVELHFRVAFSQARDLPCPVVPEPVDWR